MTDDKTESTGPSAPGETHTDAVSSTDQPSPVWDAVVRLPPLPSKNDLNLVYQTLNGLAQMDLRIEFPEKNVILGQPMENLFQVFQLIGPLKNNTGGVLSEYPTICYFIEDPFIVADKALHLRKMVTIDELYFALRNPDDWRGFWETAVRGLKTWGEFYETMQTLSQRVCQIWPEVPEHTLLGFWLAQMSVVWMRYGHTYFLIGKDSLFEQEGGSQFISREIWDPVQSLGEWGIKYQRAWSAGFFDTTWYYRLLKADPKERTPLRREMEIAMRILKGRYLMLASEETEYTVNPTYNEEYMTLY